jgi:hypothetical protein
MVAGGKRLLASIQADLEQHADAEYRTRAAEYSKKQVDGYLGVSTPIVRKIASEHYREIEDLGIRGTLTVGAVVMTFVPTPWANSYYSTRSSYPR